MAGSPPMCSHPSSSRRRPRAEALRGIPRAEPVPPRGGKASTITVIQANIWGISVDISVDIPVQKTVEKYPKLRVTLGAPSGMRSPTLIQRLDHLTFKGNLRDT